MKSIQNRYLRGELAPVQGGVAGVGAGALAIDAGLRGLTFHGGATENHETRGDYFGRHYAEEEH